MGLWYPKDSGFELIAFDHACCLDTCKSTSDGIQFLVTSGCNPDQNVTWKCTLQCAYLKKKGEIFFQCGSETKEGLCKELQFSLVDNSKLNVDFQDSPDDEEDTRSNHEYLNDLEEEYEARALLAKSKWFFKKGTQRFISAKATDQIECNKCGKKGHFTRDCWSKTSVPPYQSPFQPKPLSSSQHKPELRHTKDFKAKYNKVKAKLALLSLSDSDSKAATINNKGLIAEAYEWDEEEVS
ncbi:retrovirus-related pol polyprotein from transposon TNT 1-94 [Tanacetum coccineum]